MNDIKFLGILLLVFFPFKATAQISQCGTELNDHQKSFELDFKDTVTTITEVNRTIHISLFIVRDKAGETNMDISALNTALSALNNAFDEIKLAFTISSVNYIENYHFDNLTKNGNEFDMVTQNHIDRTINLYLVSHLFDGNDQEVCGYTYFPAEEKDIILLSKTCLDEAFIIGQFGHFFNLYHTHEKGFAEELADGSNCDISGDLCCDTPADPDLTGRVTPDCQYASTVQDANGKYYAPSVYNFMSFSPGECNKCYFSDEQYIRVINCILITKSHLW